jgi:hypothetical protein
VSPSVEPDFAFDPNDLRVEEGAAPPRRPLPARRLHVDPLDDFFGPTTGEVFIELVRLPGLSWAVYLIALRLAREKGLNPIPLSTVCVKEYGLSRNDKSRALKRLEKAGLIRVDNRLRKNPCIHPLKDQVKPKTKRRTS